MLETVLAVDIGTTSLKSGLITDRGEVVSFYTYRFQNPCDRFIANEWLFGLGISVRRLIEKCSLTHQEASPHQTGGSTHQGCSSAHQEASTHQGGPEKIHISAISISGNGPTVVLPNGITVRWNEKTPAYPMASPAAARSLFLPKILALKNLFFSDFEKAPYIFSGPEYLIYQLTGAAVTVLPEARFQAAYWNEEILDGTGINIKKLPPFVGLGQLCGRVKADLISSQNLGHFFDAETPVFSAGPDFTAAMIGTNTLAAGKICDRSGSSEGFNYCIPRPIVHEGARSLPSVIPGLWNISVLTPSSSKLSTEKRLGRVVQSVEKLRLIAKENHLDFPDTMVVTGGQAKSNEYMIKKARLLGMNLIVSNCIDAELMGDACCGWVGLGRYGNIQEGAEAMFQKSVMYEGVKC